MDSNKIKKGLGRGLSSLIGETKVEEKINQLPVSDLVPNKYQPRKMFNEENLVEEPQKEDIVKKEIKDFINEKETEKKDLEKNAELKEFVLEIPKNEGVMNLRDPNEIYLDIYKAAKEKAKQAKLAAVKAYLEAKKIKQSYLMDELDTSDDDSEFDDEVFSEK